MPIASEVAETLSAVDDAEPVSPLRCRRAVGMAGGAWQRRYDWEVLGADRWGVAVSPDVYVGCALGSGPVRFVGGVESAPFLKLVAPSPRDDDGQIAMWVAPHLGAEWWLGDRLVVGVGLALGVPQVGGDLSVRFYPTPEKRAEGIEVRAAVYGFGPSSRLLVGYTWDAGGRHVRE